MTEANDEQESPSSPHQLDEETAYDLLANARRRQTLKYVIEQPNDSSISAKELAVHVAAKLSEDGAPAKRFEQSVYVSLTQNHLVQLDEHEVIDYDVEEKRLTAGPRLDQIGIYLAESDETDTHRDDAPQMVDGPQRMALLACLLTVAVLGVALLGDWSIPRVVSAGLLFVQFLAVGSLLDVRARTALGS